ncbi:SDR family NAD(P)-dependent oxidoreductase [Pseudoglutamicibacter albus]|uniref:NAD(P)-dependent dehydrogenase (Short-subunit alcohol dehydrogenase family) n=1 Tax=Pseudoglutamicibacter albus TaxID=98671 RepID=A0ABU1YZA5_9MICC|nr:SDR family oxidoreductase [Pseudoglutamicibacter albus]MDR7292866.1 NAD(P)-dependent dehydrogenase (short-subunit alcohol dehydrogenase family) [Pseudoglutamicibacter albus]
MSTATPERVLITGGANGIGAAIAKKCHEAGYETVILDRAGDDAIHCDLSDPESTRAALEQALAGGPITRLVNNVGAVFANSLSDQTVEEFDNAVALNLRSAFLCAQALVPGMREAGFGRIVNIASRAALGKELRTAYSATKAGLQGMTRTWALEEGKQGITVNAVAPGPIATELFMNANPADSERTKAIVNSIPVGRMGTPDDVAHAAAFLLSTDAGFITGQTLYVCGGMTVGAHHD